MTKRAAYIDRWLFVTAIVLTFFGIVVAGASYLGYQRFWEIENRANKSVEKTEQYGEEARQYGEEAKRSAEEAKRSGEEAKRSGEEAKRSGEEAKRSGEEAKRFGEEAKRSGEEAKRSGEEAKRFAEEAKRLVEETKGHRDKVEKDAKAVEQLRNLTAKMVADAASTVVPLVDKIKKDPEASLIEKAIAHAASLQQQGERDRAIEQWRAVARVAEGIDNDQAARAVVFGWVFASKPGSRNIGL